MADNTVVKIANVQCTVWPKFDLHGPEPGIIANDKSGSSTASKLDPMRHEPVAIDAMRNRIAKRIYFDKTHSESNTQRNQ